jgi:hypothetical protein
VLSGVHRKSDADWAERAHNYGVKWFTSITMANLLIGFWFLFSIPKAYRMAFMGEGQMETAVLWLGVVLAMAAMHFAKKNAWLGLVLTAGSMALMAVARQRLRDMILQPTIDVGALNVNAQWDVFAVFAVLLGVGLAAVVWMLRKFASESSQT